MTIKPNFFIVGAPKCGTTVFANRLLAQNAGAAHGPKKEHHWYGCVWWDRVGWSRIEQIELIE